MLEEISNFLHGFKNSVVEADEIVSKYSEQIKEYKKYLLDNSLHKEYEDNFFTILGYTYRLDDVNQRLFFTFQEAVYAIDLDKLMRNEDSMKLNSIVYILVLDVLIEEFKTGIINQEQKSKALQVYGKIEESKAKENQKYHMYQY